MIKLNVTLNEGVDRQEFLDSFQDSVTIYYFLENSSTDLFLGVEDSYLETFSSDPRIAKIEKFVESETVNELSSYPPYPSERVLEGQNFVSFSDNGVYNRDAGRVGRTRRFGSNMINFDTLAYSDSMGPNRKQNPDSTRLPFGSHPEDLAGAVELKDFGTSAQTSWPSTFKNRFFGENVDIVIWEGGSNPLDNKDTPIDSTDYEANLFDNMFHPDFTKMPDSGSDILPMNNQTFPGPQLAAYDSEAPLGPYTSLGASRIKLRDWTTPLSSGSSLGSTGALKSRYENTNLTKQQRNPFTAHGCGSISAAGGLIGGFAKKANLYPFYHLGGSQSSEMDYIINFHRNKERNTAIKYYDRNDRSAASAGVKNPTVVVLEFGSSRGKRYFAPVESISKIVHKGETINRPATGWGSNLQPFVDVNLIPFRIEDPDNPGTFYWTVPWGDGAEKGPNKHMKSQLEKAWNAGIHVVVPAGNCGEVFARPDEIEYNTYFNIDKNSNYFKLNLEDDHITSAGNVSLSTGTRSKKVYPFRGVTYTTARDKSISVAAGQNSESHPILDAYSNRGPGIDVIGGGIGTFTAYPIHEFEYDTTIGGHASLHPTSSMWAGSVAYPFSAGDLVRINAIGSGGTAAWRTYLDSPFANPRVGDKIVLPQTHPNNIPPGAEVTQPGWQWGFFSGTSSAGPTVAGKLACILEEYLHTNKRWPTPNEAKNILMSQAKEVDAEAPSTYWKNVPAPAFGRTLPSGAAPTEQYIFSSRESQSFPDIYSSSRKSPGSFETSTGKLEPDLSLWTAINHGTVNINPASIASIKSTVSTPGDVYISKISKTIGTAIGGYYIGVKGANLEDGSPIIMSGITDSGWTALNGNTYYVKKRSSTGTYYLYSDQALTTLVPHISNFDGSYLRSNDNSIKFGHDTIITAQNNESFKDLSNAPINFNIGNKITVAGTNSSLNNGDYRIKKINKNTNPMTLEISNWQLPLDSTFADNNAVTDFTNATFTANIPVAETVRIGQIQKTASVGTVVKLKNSSAGAIAQLSTNFKLFGSSNYRIVIDSDNTVGIKLTRVSNNDVEVDTTTILQYGTLQAEEARTKVKFGAITKDGNYSSGLFWNQLKSASFDFDGNGSADALTDGLLLLRYLFGLEGSALTDGAMAADSPLTSEEVRELLSSSDNISDIDASGKTDALTDGLLLLRYLFGLTGDALISGAVAPDAARTDADEILEYIERLLPGNETATYGFRSSFESVVPHSRARPLINTNISMRTTDYFVSPTDEKALNDYLHQGTEVGAEMWDAEYFSHSKYDGLRPFTKFPRTAWQWFTTEGTFLNNTNLGSISTHGTNNNTFVTAGGVTHTITDMWWTEGQKEWNDPHSTDIINPRTKNGILCFALKGINVANTDDTFGSLNIAGKSFARRDAFYNPAAAANSVWYWHISTAPIEGSDFSALGKGTVNWSLHSQANQKNLIDKRLAGTSAGVEYNLIIQNTNPSADYETIIKDIQFSKIPTSNGTQLCTVWDLQNQQGLDRYNVTTLVRFTDLAGTPPLRAFFGPNEAQEGVKSDYLAASMKPTQAATGAVYPAPAIALSGSNDVTNLEIGTTLTKFGYNRKSEDNNIIPIEDTLESTEQGFADEREEQESAGIHDDYVGDYIVDNIIDITANIAAPTVPTTPAVFVVGPVNVSQSEEGELVTFKWQKSSDGSNFVDIATTDAVYTNSDTDMLTVLGYTSQSPVGDYYRCKVTNLQNSLTIFTNIVQAVAA